MSLKKTRAFLEYYAKAAQGVPAGAQAEEALKELETVHLAAKALTRDPLVRAYSEESGSALWVMSRIAEESK